MGIIEIVFLINFALSMVLILVCTKKGWPYLNYEIPMGRAKYLMVLLVGEVLITITFLDVWPSNASGQSLFADIGIFLVRLSGYVTIYIAGMRRIVDSKLMSPFYYPGISCAVALFGSEMKSLYYLYLILILILLVIPGKKSK